MVKWLVWNFVAVILAIGSIILAYSGIQGWGWFLLSSLLTVVIPTSSKKETE